MGRAIIVSGGNGSERSIDIKNYIDKIVSSKEESNIVIYDATYYYVYLSKLENVSYYCVDTVLPFIERISKIKSENHSITTFLVADCYGGLFYSKENRELLKDIIGNKDTYNIEIVLSARHIDFIPSDIQNMIENKICYDEVTTPLANLRK